MSWNSVLLDQISFGAELRPAIDQLLSCQREEWQALRQGELALRSIRERRSRTRERRIVVQANPGRRKSTHARTDAQSVAARKCFLCPENMPAEERGIAFGDLVILPNPYPVLTRHCTIPDRNHRPQQLVGQIAIMLELARQTGPEMLVFYNGPRCGASAPDHFHFQACDVGEIPLLTELQLAGAASRSFFAHESFGRRMLVFCDDSASHLQRRIERAVEVLQELLDSHAEPMLNMITLYRDGRYMSILFPRSTHRPACYFAAEPERLAISPAALEMAGILVVAEPHQFDRVDANTAYQIYNEVSLDGRRFLRLIELLL